MKKKITLIISLFVLITTIHSQVIDSLTINYYENYPYAFTENGKLKGIEIDIVDEYVFWLKQKKNVSLKVTYRAFQEFGSFYNSVKDGNSKVLGLGSVTNNSERENDVLFSPAYLQNLAVLITDGSVPTIKTKSAVDVANILGNLSALVVSKSSHVTYMNEIKNSYLPNLKINSSEKQSAVLESISNDKKIFGFVDIVAYWSFLKTHPTKFLKIQKIFNEPKESLGFIMPKNSIHAMYVNEFFETGFGFTSTKLYHQILEKYLGYEIIESVEIK